MIPLADDVVVMPTWVFAVLLVGLVAWNVWLMWANDATRHDLRRERHRRTVHDHLHHDGPAPTSLYVTFDDDPTEWTDAMSDRVIKRMRTETREWGGQ